MSLFIGNVSSTITDESFSKYFEEFGKCSVRIKGSFAFADYANEEDADHAMKNLQHKMIGGRKINILSILKKVVNIKIKKVLMIMIKIINIKIQKVVKIEKDQQVSRVEEVIEKTEKNIQEEVDLEVEIKKEMIIVKKIENVEKNINHLVKEVKEIMIIIIKKNKMIMIKIK
jgi:RNA recognition motif-containing protein